MGTNSGNYNRVEPAARERANELLARMTLEEKVGQMVQLPPHAANLEDEIRGGWVGSLLSIKDVSLINRLQRIAVEETRLGIPLLVGNDVIHGYRTVFPIPLAEACSWDPDLIERASRVAAIEASANGTDWIFAPMVDVARDPRWGRIAEGSGEDPVLGAAMGQARVRGFQTLDSPSGRRIVACPKHYAAYGAAEAGRDYNTVDLSLQTLRDVYLPPFRAAFEAGAGTVMSSFNEINGVPATSNAFLLRTVLRDEWGFAGVVVTDYEAIAELIPHGVAGDLRQAAAEAALAGVDMDMVAGGFRRHLAELVRDGTVPEAVVDEAARRILELKIMLGLFERPYSDEGVAQELLARGEHRDLALAVAEKSMVLLKNEGNLLPLSGQEKLAVIGPLADDRADMLGCWSWIGGRAEDVETVLEGLRAVWSPPDAISFAEGCPIQSDDEAGFAEAIEAARRADVALLVVGESADMSGEAHSRAHLGLPGKQQALVEAVAATGTPAVVVLMSGRPLVIPWIAERVPAVLQAWHPGIRAGSAVARILTGAANPSGKLAASFPRAEGQIPVYYAHKSTGRPFTGAGTQQFEEIFKSRFLDVPNEPRFPFGHGLSYTTFAYRDLQVETPVALDGELRASAVVSNTGARPGDEIVQLYVRDLVASVTRPVKELKAFQRISLQPGESQTVRFSVPVQQLGFVNAAEEYVVEPGRFKLWIGPSSADGLEGEFEVQS